VHRLLSIASLAFMLIAVNAPAAAADDRATCFSGPYTGPVRDDNVAACTRLIAAKKDLVRAYVQRARLYIRRGDNWEQAIADLAEALRLDPKSVEALSLHGVLTFNRDAARAVAEMNEAMNPPNDAADIARALRKLGFDVVEGRDLDRPGMDNAIRQFSRKLDGADIALFFYAGHGLQVNGKNYLVPIDAKLERPGDLTLDAVDIGNVLAQMEAEKRVNLIFLDACRDNPLARSLARSLGTRSSAVGQGLASIQSAIGTMIAYATQPDNVALDGEGRNSPFTAALLKHIVTPGLEIGTLMKRVRADVIAATREKQVPWDHSSLIGDVILAK
jgi:Caspase domain